MGASYDIAGSVPMLPLKFNAGESQTLSLILRPHTSNSLLVKVKDAGTGLPLSDASVQLSKTGYDNTIVTGLGYVRQTDWSSGSGQIFYTNESAYFFDDGNLELSTPAGDVKIKKISGR